MNTSDIREHMVVFASCGARVGVVDHVYETTPMLTKNDPQAGGLHHYIPLDWVGRVDQNIYLKVSAVHVMREWRSETRSNSTEINNKKGAVT